MAPLDYSFDDLPLDKDGPFGNAWGRFGDNDQLGTLNLLTPERVKIAAQEIREGKRISLDWHLTKPTNPFFGRQKFFHHISDYGHRSIHDDFFMFNSQCSTQWDGFRHFGYQDAKLFYGGRKQSEFRGTDTLGINVWTENGGIVGRGVLLDYAAWASKHNITYDPLTRYGIPIEHLTQLVTEEKIEILPGDILFIRAGFTKAYEALTPAAEAAMAPDKGRRMIGLEPSEGVLRWIWDNQLAAIAGDMPGFERAPDEGEEEPLHQWLLAGWGCPIGEMFDLEELARECTRLGRYSFFLSSVPLKVPGAVASPPNAIAIL